MRIARLKSALPDAGAVPDEAPGELARLKAASSPCKVMASGVAGMGAAWPYWRVRHSNWKLEPQVRTTESPLISYVHRKGDERLWQEISCWND